MKAGTTADRPAGEAALVTAAAWFAGGRRIPYDPGSARVLDEAQASARPGALRVFERVTAVDRPDDSVWLTMLPGFPDGSYGWAQVDRLLGDDVGPRLYVEPVGQGDSDKPSGYRYSTVERADLVGALWRHHGVRRTVVVTERPSQPQARMYGHGYRPSPLQRAQLRAAITRREGAAFLHNAAGFVDEHRRNARRWDLAAIPASWAARSRSPLRAAWRTRTNAGRSKRRAGACPKPRS